MELEMLLYFGVVMAAVGFIGVAILALPLWLIYAALTKPKKPMRDNVTFILACFAAAATLVLFYGYNVLRSNLPPSQEEVAQRTAQNLDLYDAAWNGDTVQVENLIQDGADIDEVFDKRECTVLLAATSTNHTETLEVLLRHHPANLNRPNEEGVTALQEAEAHHNAEMVRLLKQAGATEESEATEATGPKQDSETTAK